METEAPPSAIQLERFLKEIHRTEQALCLKGLTKKEIKRVIFSNLLDFNKYNYPDVTSESDPEMETESRGGGQKPEIEGFSETD
jgi:hypothetical protein